MNRFLQAMSLALLATIVQAAPELVLVRGSTSPDGRLALADAPLKTTESFADEGEVYLVEAKPRRVLQEVPHCFSFGGGFGERSENITVAWHPSEPYFVVNFRVGRLNWDGRLFKIRADQLAEIPLPSLTSHPRSQLLEVLKPNSNCGRTLSWDNHAQLRCHAWGYVFKADYGDAVYAKYGLLDFNGMIEFVFEFEPRGSLRLIDLQVSR